MKATVTLAELNAMPSDDFVSLLAGVFEHSPWVAECTVKQRPFDHVDALHEAMVAVVEAADLQTRLALIRAHPDLAGKAAVRGVLTDESAREQAGAGLDQCSPAEFSLLARLNAAYQRRFGFPFILAVRGYDRAGIIGQLERRLTLDPAQERKESMRQIYRIARFRLDDIVIDMGRRNTLRFYLNGHLRQVSPVSVTQTVLEYLREQARLTGTKEGCAEGDCGACTITEASLTGNGEVAYRSINACIRFLPTLDGKAIWTVEALAGADGSLHPVQQAMVDHHGSQCGFCTPGFVMSMYTMYQQGLRAPAREQLLDHLSGNLCRCTGYRPIIDAAQNMGAYPIATADHDLVRRQLEALAIQCRGTLEIETPGQHYIAPSTSSELAGLLQDHPGAILLAGGTDVGLWVTKQLKTLNSVIYLGNIDELKQIQRGAGQLKIGAAVLLNDGYQAIAAEYPEATELWKRFGSMPIRNSGTLVGNVANGSPIGDSAPFLIAIGAQVVLRQGSHRRTLALEGLYLDYREQDRAPDEFIEALLVPLRASGMQVAAYKLSKRFDQDISAVCSAYALVLDNGKVASLRIAHGGMAATSRRAIHTEEALLGQYWQEGPVRLAMEAMRQDYQPMTDMRASGAYRLKAAQNLLYRFYLESTGGVRTRV